MIPQKARHRQPRYQVNPVSNVKISSEQGILREHPISTLGYGGFGIYCTHKESKLLRMSEVKFSVLSQGKVIELKGSIQYFKCLPQMKPFAYFVGVQIELDPEKRKIWRAFVDDAAQKGFLGRKLS